VDFSGCFCGVVEILFSGLRGVGFSGDLWVLETVRMVDLSGLALRMESSLRRCLVGLAANASFDATRGRTVRFLSSVLFTSIRRNAYV
jgi:hypothetical protein